MRPLVAGYLLLRDEKGTLSESPELVATERFELSWSISSQGILSPCCLSSYKHVAKISVGQQQGR